MRILKRSLPAVVVLSALLPAAHSQTPSVTAAPIAGLASDGANGVRVTGRVSAPSFSQTIPGDFTGDYAQPNLWLFGGMTKAQIAANLSTQTNIDGGSCGMTVPASSITHNANCWGAYMRAQSPATAVVGNYTVVNAGADHTSIFGMNPTVIDADIVSEGGTSHPTTEYGMEIDNLVGNPGTGGFGIYLQGVFQVPGADVGAIDISTTGGCSPRCGWTYGLLLNDGSVPSGEGIYLGSKETTASSPSQSIYLQSRNSSNADQQVTITGEADLSVHSFAPGGFEEDAGSLYASSAQAATNRTNISSPPVGAKGTYFGSDGISHVDQWWFQSVVGAGPSPTSTLTFAHSGSPGTATVWFPAVSATSYMETLRTPASSSAPCTAGQFADDANYHYVCVATNTWKRVTLSAF